MGARPPEESSLNPKDMRKLEKARCGAVRAFLARFTKAHGIDVDIVCASKRGDITRTADPVIHQRVVKLPLKYKVRLIAKEGSMSEQWNPHRPKDGMDRGDMFKIAVAYTAAINDFLAEVATITGAPVVCVQPIGDSVYLSPTFKPAVRH